MSELIPASLRKELPHRLRQPLHLASRFFGSLSSVPPAVSDDRWVRSHLGPGEQRLWERMSPADQRHAVGVARAVSAELPDPEPAVVAAAILHDVGKVVSGYGTFARAAATLFWGVIPGPKAARLARRWAEGRGFGQVGLFKGLAEYRTHPELGRRLLDEAGADALTATWAAEHHLPPERWTVDATIAAVLKECDDD